MSVLVDKKGALIDIAKEAFSELEEEMLVSVDQKGVLIDITKAIHKNFIRKIVHGGSNQIKSNIYISTS